MPRFSSDFFLDAFLASITGNVAEYYINSQFPTTYAECASTALVGPIAVTGGDFTGPVDGTSGRKVTVNQQADQSIIGSGDADHASLREAPANNDAYYVTPLAASQTLTSGGTVTITAWDIQIDDPIAL